jgi:hypothetical protein
MSLLSLIGRLSLNTDGFEAGLKKAESATSAFSEKMVAGLGAAAAAAFSVATVERMISSIHDAQVEIGKLARQYGITTDEVQKLQKASGRLGLEFGDIAPILERIQKARAKAAQGGDIGEHIADNFNKLGVSDKDIVSMKSGVEILREMGEAALKNTGRLDVQNAQFEMFGKHAVVIKNIVQQLANLGPVKMFDEENIKKAEEVEKMRKENQRNLNIAFAPLSDTWSRVLLEGRKGMSEERNRPEQRGWGTSDPRWWYEKTIGTLRGAAIGAWNGLKDPTELPSLAAFDRASQNNAARRKQAAIDLDRMRSGGEMHWNSFKEVEQTTAISGIASRGGQGSLANVGGYFFGDQANQSLLSESKKTTYLLEEIKEKTEKIADNFTLDAP